MDVKKAKDLADELVIERKLVDSLEFNVTDGSDEQVIVVVVRRKKPTTKGGRIQLGERRGMPVATMGPSGGASCPVCGRPM